MTQHVRVQEFQTEKFFYKSVSARTHKQPAGGKTAPAFWAFWKKNVVFAIAKLLIHSPKWSLKSPGFWSVFLTMTCNLQGVCAWKLARFFFHSHCYTILQGLTCDLHQTFGRGVHPTPLPHPDASHQLWVNMAVGSGRGTMADLDSHKLTWTLTSPPPQPSDVTWDVRLTQANMNVNIPTPPTQWRNVRCACDAS